MKAISRLPTTGKPGRVQALAQIAIEGEVNCVYKKRVPFFAFAFNNEKVMSRAGFFYSILVPFFLFYTSSSLSLSIPDWRKKKVRVFCISMRV